MGSDDDRAEPGKLGDHGTGSETEDENSTGDKRAASSSGLRSYVKRFMNTDTEWVLFVREALSSVAMVVAVAIILFTVTGLWPPAVAVESGSMSPNMQRGDIVVIMEEHRFSGGAAQNGTGIVTYQTGATVGYEEMSDFGDVIVYDKNGNGQQTPIIHRARFWVGQGENWYEEANQTYLAGADDCEELANCPADHAGFITKGDDNTRYDQVGIDPISEPVRPSWIVGTAEFGIPWLGHIKLFLKW